jgi:serine/threonine protein phosphatase PrpC
MPWEVATVTTILGNITLTTFFDKLFRKSRSKTNDVATIPVMQKPAATTQSPAAADTVVGKHPEFSQLVAACGQSIGQQRDHNEDALFTLTTNLISDTRKIPFGLYIVADGMGGHQHGEVASAMAIRVMAGHIVRKVYLPLFSLTAKPPEQSLQEIMQEGVLEAHRAIQKQAIGGGTTLTATLIVGDQMTIAHVGDSRAYAVHLDGTLEVLTRDHSLVKRLEELGQITPEEAASHPQRNVLYRALGQGEPFDPDIITAPVPHGGYLLLCSDGLWGVVEQDLLLSLIAANPFPVQACQKLVEAANVAGGPDNISAIIARMPD